MFHTFELRHSNPRPATGEERRGRRPGLRACKECRRRKIRCTGTHPCEPCLYYKKPELCRYSDPRVPHSGTRGNGSHADSQYRSVLERLFPSVSLQSLVALTREELLDLLRDSILGSDRPPPQPPESPDEDHSRSSLEAMSMGNAESGEVNTVNDKDDVSDDVNALSIATRPPSTYLGISSINAVLKVISWVNPESIARPSTATPLRNKPRRKPQVPIAPSTESQASDQLIDAYFNFIHPSMPLLDESDFRQTYVSNTRRDEHWLALMNMVLALGSISLYPSDDTTHIVYCKRARQHLSLESLGSAHIETVQTLGIMAGHYLHYISQPNLAYVLIGAAVRMATALGLHKETTDTDASETRPLQSSSVPVDLRRRIWWSLYCLDTWGCMTLGRPTLGRSSVAVSTKPPANTSTTLILLENIRFCQIATRAQEALAASPLPPYSQLQDLDAELTDWYAQLPPLLKTYEPCPDSIHTARTRMRWSLHNLRILLYRPVLLRYALRRVPAITLHTEERLAIEKCQLLAREAICDIAEAQTKSPPAAWGVIWHGFQASLVPLLTLSILAAEAEGDTDIKMVESCREQVEVAMAAIARVEAWHPTARPSLDLIARIFRASLVRLGMMTVSSGVQVPQTVPVAYAGNELGLSSQDVWDCINWVTPAAWADVQGQASTIDLWSTPGWWQL
ncbi:putative C6 transcription factor [Aspergillus novofumigatus IBT 16806]|uniref:Putative C6 transcription factor n=1 Tax=Aspergillus novofumigatus (strain IBT 16806) TaxID=1392255 RepID=A0A2I1CBU3_ASPN1|nr:putative C6 transcription factor [Aspergillus novofumigatus IBT 16806]PKX95105.1 putative C6 transcription factor [Aspergillus novofumigatus IBT 16806]